MHTAFVRTQPSACELRRFRRANEDINRLFRHAVQVIHVQEWIAGNCRSTPNKFASGKCRHTWEFRIACSRDEATFDFETVTTATSFTGQRDVFNSANVKENDIEWLEHSCKTVSGWYPSGRQQKRRHTGCWSPLLVLREPTPFFFFHVVESNFRWRKCGENTSDLPPFCEDYLTLTPFQSQNGAQKLTVASSMARRPHTCHIFLETSETAGLHQMVIPQAPGYL